MRQLSQRTVISFTASQVNLGASSSNKIVHNHVIDACKILHLITNLKIDMLRPRTKSHKLIMIMNYIIFLEFNRGVAQNRVLLTSAQIKELVQIVIGAVSSCEQVP